MDLEARNLRLMSWQVCFSCGLSPWPAGTFSLCPHVGFPCGEPPVSLSVFKFCPLMRAPITLNQVPPHCFHFNSITYLKTLSPKTATFWVTGGKDFNICIWGGAIILPITFLLVYLWCFSSLHSWHVIFTLYVQFHVFILKIYLSSKSFANTKVTT